MQLHMPTTHTHMHTALTNTHVCTTHMYTHTYVCTLIYIHTYKMHTVIRKSLQFRRSV